MPAAAAGGGYGAGVRGAACTLRSFTTTLPLCAAVLHIRERALGVLERKNPVDDRAYHPGIDHGGDLAQLLPVGPHEQEGVRHALLSGLAADARAEQADDLLGNARLCLGGVLRCADCGALPEPCGLRQRAPHVSERRVRAADARSDQTAERLGCRDGGGRRLRGVVSDGRGLEAANTGMGLVRTARWLRCVVMPHASLRRIAQALRTIPAISAQWS